MEKLSTVAYGVIALVVVVILIFTIALPVIENAQKDQHTEVLQTGEKYSVASANSTVVLTYDSGPLLNGNPVTGSSIYVISDVCVCTATSSAWFVTSPIIDNQYLSYTMNSTSYEAKFENGTFSVTNGTDTYTSSYAYVMVPDENGDYGAWQYSDRPFYVDSGKNIYLMARTNAQSFVVSGPIDNLTVDVAISNNAVVSDATITANYEPTAYNASNKLNSLTFSAVSGLNIASGNIVFMPLKYTVITEDQNTITILLGIIPLILAIVPVMLAVQLMTGGRRD